MKIIIKFIFAVIILNLPLTSLFSQRLNQETFRQTKLARNSSIGDRIKFNKVEASSDGNGVYIQWITDYEVNNLGFNIYRLDEKAPILVNSTLITGTYIRIGSEFTQGNNYSFFDPDGSYQSVYQIETLSVDGQNQSSPRFNTRYETGLAKRNRDQKTKFVKANGRPNSSIVNKNPKLPRLLQKSFERSNNLTDINKQREIAGQAGVKIGVDQEGFYRVTINELKAAGFDIATDSNNWQLYLNGIEQAINIVDGQYFEFYGKGIDTVESDTNVYFLINGNNAGKRIGTRIRRPIGGRVIGKNFEFEAETMERELYFSSLLNGSEQNYFGSIIRSSFTDIEFDVDSPDYITAKANLIVTIQGLTNSPHRVEVKVNGHDVGVAKGSNTESFALEVGIPLSILNDGANTLSLKSTQSTTDISLFEKVKVEYKRKYVAKQNQLSFYTRNLKVTTITGFTTDDIRVFDLTYPNAPTVISNARIDAASKLGKSYNVYLPAHRTRNLYAVADSEFKQAVSIKQNFPSNLHNVNNEADMIIITPRKWIGESNGWAEYRTEDGLNTMVVGLEDTFDEFAFGERGHKGVSNFLKYAYENWAITPKYVLLMGDGSNDPRNYTGAGDFSFMPIQFVDTSYQETNSDEALADFDNDGVAEIAVGRIPARIAQDISNSLAKVINFESDLETAPARGSLCASDLPNGYDFEGLCGRVQDVLPESIPRTNINRGDANSSAHLLAELNAGKYIANYSGHGTTNSWENVNFFSTNQVPSLTNQDDLTIFLSLTCLNGYFIRPETDSLSEALLKSRVGGAVVVWSSTGSTTADFQELMAGRFFDQLGHNPKLIRIGDLIEDAKATLSVGRDVRRSWGLLGDPALRVK